MINDREIALRLRDIGMARGKCFFADGEGADMNLFCFGKTLLVCIKDAEIVQHRGDIGMFRPELRFVNLEGAQVVWFSGRGAAGFAADKSNIVQQCAEIRKR
jgi:hypothetical protein